MTVLIGVSTDDVRHIATLAVVGYGLRRSGLIAEITKRNYNLLLFHDGEEFHKEFVIVAAEDGLLRMS